MGRVRRRASERPFEGIITLRLLPLWGPGRSPRHCQPQGSTPSRRRLHASRPRPQGPSPHAASTSARPGARRTVTSVARRGPPRRRRGGHRGRRPRRPWRSLLDPDPAPLQPRAAGIMGRMRRDRKSTRAGGQSLGARPFPLCSEVLPSRRAGASRREGGTAGPP